MGKMLLIQCFLWVPGAFFQQKCCRSFHQYEVCEGDSRHSLNYNRSTEGEADIVAAWHLEGIHFAGLEIEGLLGLADAGSGFEGHTEDDRSAVADAAIDPAAMYLTEMRFVEMLNREATRQQSPTRYTLAPRGLDL